MMSRCRNGLIWIVVFNCSEFKKREVAQKYLGETEGAGFRNSTRWVHLEGIRKCWDSAPILEKEHSRSKLSLRILYIGLVYSFGYCTRLYLDAHTYIYERTDFSDENSIEFLCEGVAIVGYHILFVNFQLHCIRTLVGTSIHHLSA